MLGVLRHDTARRMDSDLQMASDFDTRMIWGDSAWATWSIPDEDLAAQRFDRAIVSRWIG